MKERELYTTESLELHLFFLRIMKEHAIFLAAGFTPVNANFSKEALVFKSRLEELLATAVRLSDGVIRPEVLHSCELVTDCTLTAEQQTQDFTGIPINRSITKRELELKACEAPSVSVERSQQVKRLNQQVMLVLDKFIRFKETVIAHVCACRMFTGNYPTLLKHVLREAEYYRDKLMGLEKNGSCSCAKDNSDQTFWNQIMMEHALFMRSLLDPCENKLIVASNQFAESYAELLDAPRKETCGFQPVSSCAKDALSETEKFRDFKKAAVSGIENCEIQSIILPLLADHVLREANHYIRLLK